MARHATRLGLTIALTAFVCIVFVAAVGGQQRSAAPVATVQPTEAAEAFAFAKAA